MEGEEVNIYLSINRFHKSYNAEPLNSHLSTVCFLKTVPSATCELWDRDSVDWKSVHRRNIYLSTYVSIQLSIHLFIYPSFYLSIRLCFKLSIYIFLYTYFYSSIFQSIYLSIYQYIYLYIYLSICLSIHLSTLQSWAIFWTRPARANRLAKSFSIFIFKSFHFFSLFKINLFELESFSSLNNLRECWDFFLFLNLL